MPKEAAKKQVIIVGGGFGGIRTALELGKRNPAGLEVTLITDKPHFEYFPTLYRIVTGYSPAQVCIPLAEIFAGMNVHVIEGSVTKVDLENKVVVAGIDSPYSYDYLVLAMGSETGYFNIPGLPELSYGFKSLPEALRLKQHLHDMLTPLEAEVPVEQKTAAAHFVIVGGGPTGVELAGELVRYSKHLAANHGFDPSFITIDIIEAAPRLLPIMPADISAKVYNYLHKAGVNIFLNRAVIGEEAEQLLLKDMNVKTKTVVWTSGVKPNKLVATIEGLTLNKRGCIEVDERLMAKGHKDVFVVGDIAVAEFGGMAQTADKHAKYVAHYLINKQHGIKSAPFKAKRPIYAIPAGPDWAAILWGNIRIYGRLARFLRNMADLRYFAGILPLRKALRVYHKSDSLAESCPVCLAKK